MFELLGGLIIFGLGVYVGRNHYEKFIDYSKKLVEKIKSFFNRDNTKR